MVQLFLGAPIENPAEAACIRGLQRDLETAEITAVILANLTVGPKRKQIDLVVATETTAIVVEVKGYIHPVHGKVNGPWAQELDDGTRRDLGTTNPYQQALDNRHAVTDGMRAAGGPDLKPAIGGMLCLYPMAPIGSIIPAGDHKVQIGAYADLLAMLRKPRPKALSLERWQEFAGHHNLRDQSKASPTQAEMIIADYLAAYRDLGAATLGPYIEPLFEDAASTEELAARCTNGEQLQVVGGSGTGKTELLKRLGAACAARGNIPVLVRARDFDRDIGPMLRADIARYTNLGTTALFRAAEQAGAEIILHVDALNECPLERRPDLVATLQAARINYGARIVVTDQARSVLPASISGACVTLLKPDKGHARSLVEAHLRRAVKPAEEDALDIVSSAQDAVVLAATLEVSNTADGRFALYHGFTQARLQVVGSPGANRGLAELATVMRSGFVSAIPTAAAERILEAQSPARFADVCRSGLLWHEGNSVGFRHELIGDFFASDALLRSAPMPAQLEEAVRLPISAELREFVLGGCATTREIEALLAQPTDSRILESALSGRAGAKARAYVLDRMRDLIARLGQRYQTIELALPEGVESARQLLSLIPSLASDSEDIPGDDLYLSLLARAVPHGLLPDLLNLFASVDRRLLSEAERLRKTHPEFRLAWRAAAFGTVYGMHHHPGARHLQKLLQGIQHDWRRDDGAAGIAGLDEGLDQFETLGIGELFLLLSALRQASNNELPPRFPELLRHVWATKVYHLRLIISDLIRFRGRELGDGDRADVRETLHEFLSNENPMLNTVVIDALEGVDGIEIDFTVEDAVRGYEAILAEPETPESRSMARGGLTSTYDHPYRDIYWEAFYDVLAREKRQALLLRALRDERMDPWVISDVLRAMARDPDPAAKLELQTLALAPLLTSGSYQFAVICFADAIRLLATLGLALAPPVTPPPEPTLEAWFRAAPLLYALNGGGLQSLPSGAIEAFLACGTAPAFDVMQRLEREARNLGFYEHGQTEFDRLWPDMVLQLVRAVLSTGYTAISGFPEFASHSSLQDDHVDAALQMLARVGRATDMALVRNWLSHPFHGEQALQTARAIEMEPAADAPHR
jgi:hypothetical protein